jgi:protein phosphatase 1M
LSTEVRVLDIENEAIGESDVLVMATDGLWDVVSNERVAEVVEAGDYNLSLPDITILL